MIKKELGKLDRVLLRDIWENEATDFTPWLVDHIHILGEALDMDLEVTGQEESVGPFSADIVCLDTSDDDNAKVLIENQLEKTDHKHLGQLLTYASGLKAVSIIWVAEQFNEEHRAGLDWLNDITGENFRFFGLEIETWQIGDSAPAPQFKIISKPNEWSKSIRQRQNTGNLADTQQDQLRYWIAFKSFMEKTGSPLQCRQPKPKAHFDFRIGKSGIYFRAGLSTWNIQDKITENEIRAEVFMQGQNTHGRYRALESQKTDIEAELGEPLIWYAPEQTIRRRIYLRNPADYFDEPAWPEQHAWLKDKLEALNRVFRDRINKLV